MITTNKDPRAVIEQLVTALEYVSQFLEDDNAAMIHVPAAITAGREALEQPEHAVPFAWARPYAVDSSQDFRFIKIDDFTVPLYDHPQASEPAPKRPPNCGTGHCSCIECVMEPAPSTAVELSDWDARSHN